MKIAHSVLAVVFAFTALGAAEALAEPAPKVTVGCHENAQVADPVVPDPDLSRVVFGIAALPRQTVRHKPVRTDDGPLRYWTKMGLLVRLGRGPVDIFVPAAWRDHVLIGWGYPNLHEDSTSMRIRRCPLPKHGEPYSLWRVYAGGVVFAEPACVPLIVRAEGRRATIHLNLGRRCP